MAKILLLTDFSSGYSRSLLKGIVKYSKEFGPWVFYRMPLYYRMLNGDKGVVEWAKKWKADAIIAQLRDVNVKELKESGIPIIVQNYRDRKGEVCNLTGDYFNTGVMAADFYLRRGYRHFAFYGVLDTVWSRERCDGFRARLEGSGYQLHSFCDKGQETEPWKFNSSLLGDWLLSLPKPVGLFACDDYFALQIAETCNIYNIRIPDEVSVLGVDNDQLMCNISDPPLSSIVLDVENGGYQAAKLLDQLIRKEVSEYKDIIINPIRIERRRSTEKYAVTNKHIATVLHYIEENYASPIFIDDLIAILPLSRRVLEKKFKQELGISIYQCIQEYRIEQFAALLISSDKPLSEIALMAGFDDYKNVFRIFKKYKKITPVQYREHYKQYSE